MQIRSSLDLEWINMMMKNKLIILILLFSYGLYSEACLKCDTHKKKDKKKEIKKEEVNSLSKQKKVET